MDATATFTVLLSFGGAAMLVYWSVCMFLLLRQDGEDQLHGKAGLDEEKPGTSESRPRAN